MQILRPRHQHQLFLHHHLANHGAQNGCMFSVLKASESSEKSYQKRKRPVFDKYAASVSSFVQSYIEANRIFPKISEVARATGANRAMITRLLDELNLNKNAPRCKEVCVDDLADMKVRHTTCLVTECMPRNTNSEDEQLAQEVASSQMVVMDAMDSETDRELLTPEALSAQVESMVNTDSETDNEQLAQEAVSAEVDLVDRMDSETDNEQSAPEVELIDGTDSETETKGLDIFAKDVEKNGHRGLANPSLLTLLNQAVHSSNKADANRQVAPLMEVLQQKSTCSSRRVNLSGSRGYENDISWDKTLVSIMPTTVSGKEGTSGRQDVQLKIIGHPSSSVKKTIDCSQNASDLQYTARLVSSTAKSVLCTLPAQRLLNTLKSRSEVFKGLKKVKVFPRISNVNSYAILQFKDRESMENILKLKQIYIQGELFSLKEGLATMLDSINTQPEGLGKRSVFQEVIQGIVGQKEKDMSSEILDSLSYLCTANKKSDASMQAPPVSQPIFSHIITIEDCPDDVPAQSIHSFFSVFGTVHTTSGFVSPSKRIFFVEFKSQMDKEKALRVQQFTVDGCSLKRRDASCDAVVVRLKFEQCEINHREVIKACKKYCSVEKVSLRRGNAMDVQFRAEAGQGVDMLLNSLYNDGYLKGKFKLSLVQDGYIDAGDLTRQTQKVEKLVVLLKEFVTHLNGVLGMKFESLNQLAADIQRTCAAIKVV